MGFNMSWIFVEGVEPDQVYSAFGVKSTGIAADPYDLGTVRFPLVGLRAEPRWCGIFGHYAYVLDLTVGTEPPQLKRLPPDARAVTCVVLEHATVSHASLWQGGRHLWQIHQQSRRLDFWGDLPPNFFKIWEVASNKQKEFEDRKVYGDLGVNYLFDVPLDTASEITAFSHTTGNYGSFRDVTTLVPLDEAIFDRLSDPPGWWQTIGSKSYR